MQRISPQTAELVERWLTEHLDTPSSQQRGPSTRLRPEPAAQLPGGTSTRLASATLAELLEAVRIVLACRPVLAQAAGRLSTYDQFRLTLDLLRTAPRVTSPCERPAQEVHVKAAARTQRTCPTLRRRRPVR